MVSKYTALPYKTLDIHAALPYNSEIQTVLFTSNFERRAVKIGLDEADIQNIAVFLAKDPLAGDLIQGSGGARKLRFARSNSGKSGGYRTIHYFGSSDVPIFLMDVIDKRERANISKAELNTLSTLLSKIADIYRKGLKL